MSIVQKFSHGHRSIVFDCSMSTIAHGGSTMLSPIVVRHRAILARMIDPRARGYVTRAKRRVARDHRTRGLLGAIEYAHDVHAEVMRAEGYDGLAISTYRDIREIRGYHRVRPWSLCEVVGINVWDGYRHGCIGSITLAYSDGPEYWATYGVTEEGNLHLWSD